MVALDRGLALWVESAAALDHANAQAAAADFGVAIMPGASSPWVVVQPYQQPTVEGLGASSSASVGASDSSGGGTTGLGSSASTRDQGSTGGSDAGSSKASDASASANPVDSGLPSSSPLEALGAGTGSSTGGGGSSTGGGGSSTGGSDVSQGSRGEPGWTIDSTLTEQSPSETLQIPIVQGMRFLGFSLTATGGSGMGSIQPAISEILVEDQSGDTLAQAVPDLPMGGYSPQALTLALRDAPVGGRVIVRISAASIDPSANAGASGSWSVPFALSITRRDAQPGSSAASDAMFQSGDVSVGPLAPTSPDATGIGALDSAATTDPAGSAVVPTDVATTQAAPAATDETAPTAATDGWLPAGPLISRSAGPLGLILASITAEPTAGVDRSERAFSENPDQGDSNFERIVSRGVESRFADRGRSAGDPADPTGGSSGVVVVERGSGLLPLYATAAAGRRLGDPARLLEGLAPPSVAPLAASGAIPADPPRDHVDRRAAADVIRAALGLVVGLGLTTGPLFSDLLAQARSSARKRSPALADVKNPPRKPRFGTWLASWFA